MPIGDLGVQRGMCLFFSSDRDGPKITERKKKEEIDESSCALPCSGEVPPLPEEGPTLALIKARLSGKKAKGNVYLT